MDENENQNVENNNEPQQESPRRNSLRNKGKELGKKAGKNLSNALKGGLKKLWQSLPPKVKLIVAAIIVVVVFLACVVVVLANHSVDTAETNISNHMSALPEDSESRKFYDSTGSLLLITDDDVSTMADNFFETAQLTNNSLYELMKEKYKTGALSLNLPIFPVSAKHGKTLYEHFLNTERYNFNSIKWVKYTRSKEDGEPEMQLDSETRLQYPEDSENTNLETFANMAQPYLQNYRIPYAIYVGLITDGKIRAEGYDESSAEDESVSKQFAYEMIKSALHDIQINQYNIKSYTKITEQTFYDLLKLEITHTVTINESGTRIYSNYSDPIITTISSCVPEPSTPKLVDEYTNWDIRYCLKYAKLFDKYVINEYMYTEYDLNNEPDDQTVSRAEYKDSNYEKYESSTYDIPESAYNYEYNEDGTIKRGTYRAEYTMKMKKGYTDTISSTWKDTLEILSHEERAYTVADVKEGLDDGEELSQEEEEYYKLYENDGSNPDDPPRINTFDLANSKKSIYKNYLADGEEFSSNIGYSRSWLVFSFYVLKESMKTAEETDNGWKYFYGSSIGAKEATIATDNTGFTSDSNLINVDYSSLPDGKLGWPSPGHTRVSSYFGKREGGGHRGIDISMPSGSTFVASAAGEVVQATTNCKDNYGKADALSRPASDFCGGGAGNYVKIKVEGTEMYLLYMHMTTVTVKAGDKVEAGQAIGTCGSTGRSTAPHAHFEVRVGGASGSYAVDPLPLLQKDGT